MRNGIIYKHRKSYVISGPSNMLYLPYIFKLVINYKEDSKGPEQENWKRRRFFKGIGNLLYMDKSLPQGGG